MAPFSDRLAAEDLVEGWEHPPREARLRAYWWWLNGQVTREAITRDLEEMRAKGWGGALICDADGSSQDGNDRAPHGPDFFSADWRALYRHALQEADRLGLEMSLNIQSGWNLGGPMVTADDAAKKLVWSEARVLGPGPVVQPLPQPASRDGYYRDLFVVAYPAPPEGRPAARPLQNWEQKAMHRTLHFSAPDTRPLLVELPDEPGEEDAGPEDVRELSRRLGPDGVLRWEAPEGEWVVLRFGCTLGDHARVSTSSEGWQGYALDPLDAGAFRRYWDAVVEPLIADAGPLAGRTLRYLHTDSWEVEAVNWTPTLRDEFRRRRGYDFAAYAPVLAGRIIGSRRASHRFLHDFRRTLGDLAVANYYGPFREGAHRHGLLIHPESGGPHAVPIDAQQCLGANDVPMSEFWAWSWRHRVGDANRFFLKQPASAAHTYGHRYVAAEGFTTIGPHWQETIWDNLKPAFDKALCEGMNLLVWHAVVCSPAEMGRPGIQYFAGTHFNPNTTWWSRSGPFIDYINRCQWMLQQGLFVADACYYYGNHVPNFAQLKQSDPARVLPGYDYDVISEEALLDRLEFRNGRLELPDGMSYRVLVLPDQPAISLPVLRKVRELVVAGATVIGRRPEEAVGLSGQPAADDEVASLAAELWGAGAAGESRGRSIGQGRVVPDLSARELLLADGVPPDFAFTGGQPGASLDYLHRRDGTTEIYFVANRSNRWEQVTATFRVADRAPELWNPVTGEHRLAGAYEVAGGRTALPLEFPPCGSWFVVFRQPAPGPPATRATNAESLEGWRELAGSWVVDFDPAWGGPGRVAFERLVSWPERAEPGIRFYSGTATYRREFEIPRSRVPSGEGRILLDLGNVRELAEVRLNGHQVGIVWAPPFRVDLTPAVRAGANQLEIDVVNFWPNRIIGDASLPPAARRTRTNIRKLTAETRLMESGLLGPVRLLVGGPSEGPASEEDTDRAHSRPLSGRPDDFPVKIVVDARRSLGPLRPIWRFFGADEPNYAYLPNGRKLLGELGALAPRRVYFRAHNLLTSGDGTPALKWGSTGVYREDDQGNAVYDWTLLDRIFDSYLENGVRPYAQIGFMPRDLSVKPDPYQHAWTPTARYEEIYTGWAYPPRDYARWGELVRQWVAHCVDRYGREEVEGWYWETWNEANIGYWRGTQEEFLRLHDHAIQAVREVLPTARVGGPDCAGDGGRWMRRFLEHCLRGTNYATGRVGTPLDFVAFHAKGAPVFTNGHVRMGLASHLRTIDRGFDLVASYPELRDTPVIIGESDPEGCAACQGPQLGYRNGTMYSSYTAASFARKQDLADRHGIRFEGALTWAFEFEDQPWFAGFRSLASNGVDKPVLNVFRLLAMMSGERIRVRSDGEVPLDQILAEGVRDRPDVAGLASLNREANSMQLLVWHYHDDDLPGPAADVALELAGLPFADGEHSWRHYRIDADHSNAFAAWQRMGSPAQPAPEQVEALQRAGELALVGPPSVVTLEGGRARLRCRLPRQAVSLIVLE